MNDAHSPRLLNQPVQVRSNLQLSSHSRTDAAGADPVAAAALAEALTARVDLDQAVVNRLFELWNTLLLVEAALAVMVEGIDVPLWFAELIDLHDLERKQPGPHHLTRQGAAS